VPSAPAQRPSGGDRGSFGGSVADLPSLGGNPGVGNRPSQLPTKPGGANRPGPGIADRPVAKPGERPGRSDVGNFLGAAGAAAGGAAIGEAFANRPSTLPADRAGVGNRPGERERPVRPEQRPNWASRSKGRNEQWQQRVDTRNDAWNQRADNRQQARNDFQKNRDQRWNNLQNAQQDRQNWRDQNREDWQKHREDLWDYRGDRAEEVWDNARDFYDDVFDDRWWGAWGWGAGYVGMYPSNPWWWWAPAAFGAAANFVSGITPDPVYVDYGMNVIYEGDTVYVDNQPVPAAQYSEPMIELAENVEQPPPPSPPAPETPAAEEWMPLGVFALAQEEKGDPVMFFQISVNRAGAISGGYSSTITLDRRPIAGQIDKASQRAGWRIGENKETIFESSLANLTQDVSPLVIHFGNTRTQTWLLVRMPEPAPAGQPQKLPEKPKSPPPLKTASAKPK
jgi:hypothetical protein